MKAVIYGCGAIGSHIAYSLYEYGFEVIVVARGKTYNSIIKKGLKIQINENKKILKKKIIKINSNFKIYNSLNQIKDLDIDFFFITIKLKDYNQLLINKILTLVNSRTAIIPPCTNIPIWWIHNFYKKKTTLKKNKYFDTKNIIGMTMWLSAVIKKPGDVLVRHIQRGYPLKEINNKMIKKAHILRKVFRQTSKSPKVNDIYSELYTKSLNALAFNLVAIYYNQNNANLKKNDDAVKMIRTIMIEGEKVMKILDIKHIQNYNDRINQTLSSSVHTMSMLNDFRKRKKNEIKFLWKSFKILLSIMNIEMKYTEKIYIEVSRKTN